MLKHLNLPKTNQRDTDSLLRNQQPHQDDRKDAIWADPKWLWQIKRYRQKYFPYDCTAFPFSKREESSRKIKRCSDDRLNQRTAKLEKVSAETKI